MKKVWILGLVALLMLALAGCSGVTEKDLVGSWTGKITVTDAAKKDMMSKAGQIKGAGNMAKQMIDSMDKVTLQLDMKEDKTFTMTGNTSGTWALADGKVTLTIVKYSGMSVDQVKRMAASMGANSTADLTAPISGAASSSSLTLASSAQPGVTMNFTKAQK